jgi:hypothetical protein
MTIMDMLAARTIIGIPAPKPATKAISFEGEACGTVVPLLEVVVEEAVEVTGRREAVVLLGIQVTVTTVGAAVVEVLVVASIVVYGARRTEYPCSCV